MNTVLKELVNKLNKNQLEMVFDSNKLEIQGFRLKGKTNNTKLQKMKKKLITSPNLEELIKKAIVKYKHTYGSDYTWALASDIDIDIVEKKVKETNVGDVGFALIDCSKNELLMKLLLSDENEEHENTKINTQSEATQVIEFNETIKNLRELLESSEKEKNKIHSRQLEGKEERIKLNREKEELTKEIRELKKKNEALEEAYEQKEKEYQKALKSIEDNDSKYLIVGSDVYRSFVEITAANLKYDFICSLENLEGKKKYEKLIVLNFTFNKIKREETKRNEVFKRFLAMQDTIIINSKNELENIIKNMEDVICPRE